MILVINTIVGGRLLYCLVNKKGVIISQDITVGYKQAEKFLPLLDNLLKSNKIKINSIKEIIVAVGPGGFSSVRLGMIMANTLSYSLNIPAVGLKTAEFKNLAELINKGFNKLKGKKGFNLIKPFYGKPPNITKSKKR